MKKIQSLFKRNYEGNRQVINEVVEGSEWVINGEGKATRKYDGTAAMVKDGILYKRPDVGIPCEPAPNEHTGHWPWWVPVTDSPEDKYFKMAFNNEPNGTYELVGPKINGNKDKFSAHILIRHGIDVIRDPYRNFENIKFYLQIHEIEGIVWHHPDGRMVKIKRKDFGFEW